MLSPNYNYNYNYSFYGGTGNCNSEGITYNLKCKTECETKDRGESSGNGYTRGDEHLTNLNNRDLRQSPLWRHCLEVHNGEVQEFEMNVTRSFKNDAMLRQITEAVQIDNTEQGRLMNTRAE